MSNQKAGKYACYEFERKFLLPELPSSLKSSSQYKQIEDIYFVGTNLRYRTLRSPDGKILDRKLTQKYVSEGSDLSATTITNIYLGESEAVLLDKLQGSSLRKNRFKFSHAEQNFSIDEFKFPCEGLVIAEVEFDSKEEMNGFKAPFSNWKEVTLEAAYSGGFLASKMSTSTQTDIARKFWQLFSDQLWDKAAEILANDFLATWPQSRERIVDAKNFIDVNKYYPGNHKIEVIHAFAIGSKVLTTVWIEADTGQKTFANSIFDLEGDKILNIEEYWAEPYPAPEWRKQWVETY